MYTRNKDGCRRSSDDIKFNAVLFLLMLASTQGEGSTGEAAAQGLFELRKSNPAATGCLSVNFAQNEAASGSTETKEAVPSFNTDGHYFTPAFILPCDVVRLFPFRSNAKKTFPCTTRCTLEKPTTLPKKRLKW